MIINSKQQDIIKTGEDTAKKATINQDKLAKLQHILTKGLYSDPESAVIVEWTNNAVDSVVASGKDPVKNPVIVSITKNKLSVKDNGLGLNKEDFEHVVMNYLTSTKENDNTTIGHFGLGSKSFLSLDRSATFICIKDGIEYKFLAYQGVEFMEYDLIYEKETEEENGVTCEVNIQDWSEYRRFCDKAKRKLAYYDTVALFIDEQLVNNQIVRSEDWQHSELADNSKLHLCLKDVYYDIDWGKIDISPIYIPIALRFDLNSGLTPTPSRESLIYTKETIDLIKNKIKKVADWFVNKYNEQNQEEKDIIKDWDYTYFTSHSITVNKNQICIDNIFTYSDISLNSLKFKGIKFNDPKFYYDHRHHFSDQYECIVNYREKRWQTKHVSNHTDLVRLDYTHILVNKVPTGKLKTFLLEKYKNKKILFIKYKGDRKLGKVKNIYDYSAYRFILNLSMHFKVTWRKRIQEWQFVENQFRSFIVDETNCENTKDYIDWVSEQKEIQKSNRKSGFSNSNYKILNKQQGDVTLAYAVPKLVGDGYKFDKTTRKISELHKYPGLTILFNEDQKDIALQWRNIQDKWKVAIIGKNELKKIESIHNHITYKQFKMDSKVFKRIATSFLFEEVIEQFQDIFRTNGTEIIQKTLTPIYDSLDKLKDYNHKNGKYIRDNELCASIKAIAKENNLYDYELWEDYIKVKESIEKYSFISLLKNNTHNSEDTKKIKRLIAQILLFQQKYHNLHTELEITLKDPISTDVNEEQELILETENN